MISSGSPAGSQPGSGQAEYALVGISYKSDTAPDVVSLWRHSFQPSLDPVALCHDDGKRERLAEAADAELSRHASSSLLTEVVRQALTDGKIETAGQTAIKLFVCSRTLTYDDLVDGVTDVCAMLPGINPSIDVAYKRSLAQVFVPVKESQTDFWLVVCAEQNDAGFGASALVLQPVQSLAPSARAYCTLAGWGPLAEPGNRLDLAGLLYVVSQDATAITSSLPDYAPLVAKECFLNTAVAINGDSLVECAALLKAALSLYHRTIHPSSLERSSGAERFNRTAKARAWIHARVHPKLEEYTRTSDDFKPTTARHAAVIYAGSWQAAEFDPAPFLQSSTTAIVLREYDDVFEAQRVSMMPDWESEVCIISGASARELLLRIDQLGRYLGENPHVQLKDVAFSLSRQDEFRLNTGLRIGIVAGSLTELMEKLSAARQAVLTPESVVLPAGVYMPGDPYIRQGKTAFILPGLGAAYPDMLADLALHFPDVRGSFDFVDALSSFAGDKIQPSKLIFTGGSSQPAIASTAMLASIDSAVVTVLLAEWSLFEVLCNIGVRPDMLIGCSTGEFAALTISGAADIVMAAPMFYRLSTKMARSVPRNSLANLRSLKINANYRDLSSLVADLSDVYLSADLSPMQHLVSGSKDAIAELGRRLEQANIEFNPLPMAIPYHTPLVSGVIAPDNPEVAALPLVPPQVQTWSCSTASPYPQDIEQIRQITTELFSHSILFQQTVQAAYAAGATKFVEVGPKSTLTPIVSEVLSMYPHLSVASNTSARSGISQINHLIAALAAANGDMMLDYLFVRRQPQLLNIFHVFDQACDQPLEPGFACEQFEPSGNESSLLTDLGEMDQIMSNYFENMAVFHEQLMTVHGEVMSSFLNSQTDCSESEVSQQYAGMQMESVAAFPLFDSGGMRSLLPIGEAPSNFAQRASTGVVNTNGHLPMELTNPLNSDGGLTIGTNSMATELIGKMFASISTGSNTPDQTAQFPFLRRGVLSIDRGSDCAELLLSLNPSEDLYLLDHAIGGMIRSTVNERVHLLPLTVAMEIMAETASTLLPGLKLIRFENVSAAKRIRVPKEGCVVRARAQLIKNAGARAELVVLGRHASVGHLRSEASRGLPQSDHQPDLQSEGVPRAAMSCELFFSENYKPAPSVSLPEESLRPSKIGPEQLYGPKTLFHGPTMRSIVATGAVGEKSISTEVEIRGANNWFSHIADPKWVCDPLLLDNATQAVLLYLIEQDSKPEALLPFFADSVEFFAELPAVNQRATVCAKILRANPSGTESDITIEAGGRVIARLRRLSHKTINVPSNWSLFIEAPTASFLTTELDFVADKNDAVACLANNQDLPGDDATLSWCSDYILSATEAGVFANLPNSRRRREWLLGRMAAKDAVRRLSASRLASIPSPAEVEIEHLENGQPVLTHTTLGRLGFSANISITHKDGIAAAVACQSGTKQVVGIDLESICAHDEGFLQLAFNHEERRDLAAIPENLRNCRTTQYWSAKEAVGKALGTGLANNPKSLQVEVCHSLTADLSELRVRPAASQPGTGFIVRCLIKPDYVVAITLFDRA